MGKNKKEMVDKLIKKIKSAMYNALQKNNCEKAMAAISVGCQILYEYNQVYTDNDFENGVLKLANDLKKVRRIATENVDNNTVLFYDGFGLDVRGVSKMYLNALKKNGYRIIYVTALESKGKLLETEKVLKGSNHKCYYVSFKTSYTKWLNELIDIMMKNAPKAMFYYTTPYDVSGAVAFAYMNGCAERFLIDLTDHAFWLGVKCNDFFCGSREISASNQVYERGINRNKVIKLGVNLVIDDSEYDHSGLPFDVIKEKYIFSGGALYKTLGDKQRLYYRIVDHILENNKSMMFLYAGEGDRTEMDKILNKYPKRAFLIPERKDFYYLIENCVVYLNTYPMFGGMMMKYSANAGKLPITLRHENDSDGLLVDQGARRIEYDTFDELILDVDKLLSDQEYLLEREKLLEGSIISEERFVNNLRLAIEEHRTDYEHSGEHIETTKFKKEFYDRFDIKKAKGCIAKRINKPLFFSFPWMFIILAKNRVKLMLKR